MKHSLISRTRLQTSTMLTSVLAMVAVSQPAMAVEGGNVVGGSASIQQSGANTNIHQSSNRALIEWGNFDIGSNESVNFFQPGSSSIALNRVVGGGGASQINGMLKANGNVIIVNSQGVMFGAGAQVNVGGIVATTADVDNAKFMAGGNVEFSKAGNVNAVVKNEGSINVVDGGLALLVGPSVANTGLIQAKLGKAQLASGETFTVDMVGDGLLSVQASDKLAKQLVANSGKIEANGGEVLLTAAAAQSAVESVINMDGIIQADSIGTKGGKVILSGANTTLVSGKISAKGNGTKGGNVDVLGKNVALLTGAEINASGDTGGGKVRVGGDVQGQGSTPTSTNTVIQSGSTILANALVNGDGGDVSVWADNNTFFYGDIEAKGGAQGGNGGFVETSGKIYLDAFGSVTAGSWLLDPNNITITDTPNTDNNVSGNPNFTTTSNTGRVSVASIQSNLNSGTNVTISTGTAGANSQAGNIDINANILKSSGTAASLTLNAHNTITLNNGVSISSTSDKLNVTFNAASGRVDLNNGSSILSNGGDVVFAANNNVAINGTVNTGAGTFLATSSVGNVRIQANGTVTSAATGDAITIAAISGNFINNRGSDALTASNGRWLVYSQTPTQDTIGGLSSSFRRFSCTYGGSCPVLGTGNGLLYATTPYLTISPVAASTTYGQAAPSLTYTLNGYLDSDAAVDHVSGAANVTTAYVVGNDAGTYDITAAQGTLASEMGYGFAGSTLTGGLTVNKADLEISVGNQSQVYAASKVYTVNFSTVGLYSGDSINGVQLSTNATESTSGQWNVGVWDITPSNANGANGHHFNPNNYNITYVNGTLTITPRALIVSAAANDKVYDGNNSAIVNLSDNRITGDVLNVASDPATFSDKNVGVNKTVTVSNIAISGTDSANYVANTTATDLADITPASLTITANDKSQTYGAGNTGNGFTSSGLQGTDAIDSVDYSSNATTSTSGNWEVGNWALTASNASGSNFDSGNYTITYANGALTITKRDLTVSATAQDKVYDGNRNATVSLSNDAISGDLVGQTYTTARFGNKNAGNNKTVTVNGIAINGADADNYNLTSTTATDKARITKAALTVTANNQSQVYGDGNTLTNGYQVTGLVAGETVGSVGLSTNATTSTSGNLNAGSWNIIASGASGGTFDIGNYAVTYVNGNLNILKKNLTTVVTANDKVYDATRTATVTFSDDRISGDVFSETYSTARFGNKNVGNNKTVTVNGIALSGTDAGNYNLLNTIATDTANITPAALNLAANDVSMTYGDGNNLGGFTATGLQGGETVGAVNLATNATSSTSGNWNAGNWAITIGGASGGTFNPNNYTITYSNGSLAIAQKALIVSAVANDKVYDGNNSATVTLSDDRISGDVLSVANDPATFDNKNVGTDKTVTVSNIAISGTDSANYVVNTTATDLADITPASLTITANGKSQTYGDGNSFNGYVVSGLQGTDAVDGVNLTTNAGTSTSGNWNAGNWSITASNANGVSFDPNNYAITYVDGVLSIAQKALTITATANDKVYDGNANATVTLSDNRIGGDVVTRSFTSATFSDKNVGNDKTVTVAGLSISGTDAANYIANTSTIALADITPASLTIRARNDAQVYGDGNVFNGYTITGLKGGDTVGSVDLATNATTSTSGNWKTGLWTITASNANGGTFSTGNYNITYQNGTLLITPKLLLVGATGGNKVYDGTRDTTVTLTDNRISGDVFNETYSTARFANKNVGNNKVVTVNGIAINGGDSSNYLLVNPITFTTANITPAALTITANGKSMTYGDGNTLNGYSTTGLVAGETIGSVNLATNATSSTSGNWNAGNWAITASGATNSSSFNTSNYTITYNSGALSIAQKALIVSAAANDKVYDANTAATVTLSDNRISGDVFNVAKTSADFDNKNVGTDKTVTVLGISLSGTDAANYIANTSTTALADITPASLTITANDQSQTYGDGNNLTQGYASVGLQGADAIDTVDLATDATNSGSGNWNAGTWSITASNPLGLNFDANNYTITFVDGVLSIAKKDLTVSATAQDKVYDATTTASVNLSDDRISGDVFNAANTSADFDNKNVGTDKTVTVLGISISGTDADNYNLTNVSATDLADITPASLTITANDQSQTYGDGNNFTQGYASVGLQGADAIDTVDLATDATNSASLNWNAGSWAITASNPLGLNFDANNYAITFVDGVLTVTPKTLSVVADNQTKVYGSPDPSLTYAANGFVAGEDESLFTGGLDRDAGESVVGSPYTINLGTLSAGSNYTIDYTEGFLNITPYMLSVIADDQTKVYGDLDPALTYSFGALQNGDDSSVFTGGLERDAGESVAGGPYVINIGSLSAGSNYTISYTDGLLRITPATLSVIADNQSIRLGDNIPALTYTASGFKFKDGYEVFTGGLRTVPRESLPGIYSINRGTLEANSNYVIDYTRGLIAISSPFDNNSNSTSEQLSSFTGFSGPSGQSTLLSMQTGGANPPAGGLGGLAPAAGGNLGDLSPSAGGNLPTGNTFALIECNDSTPCDAVQ